MQFLGVGVATGVVADSTAATDAVSSRRGLYGPGGYGMGGYGTGGYGHGK